MSLSDEKLKRQFIYDVAVAFFGIVASLFFREVRPRGAYKIPRDGPVIFVGAPHNNQFLDTLLLPLEVYKETHRRVRSLAAAKSMKRKAVGFFIRLMDSIPVARAQDEAKRGLGTVHLSPADEYVVLGEKTRFTKQCTPRCKIVLPKSVGSASAEVAEIISDTEVRLKKPFGDVAVLEDLRQRGPFEYKVLPYIDQHEMYNEVYECLRSGGSIGIFPEGGSHDRTDLLPLKAGVAIMALGAMANYPDMKVKIMPVGLSYFHPHRFRSRAVVEFGSPLDVPPEYVEMFKQGDAQKRKATSLLLDMIFDALKTVTVQAPDYDTLMLIQAVRRLYETPGQHLSLGQVVNLNRLFLEGYQHFKDEPRVQKLKEAVLKYNRLIRSLGLRDHQVPRAKKASWKTFGLLLSRLAILFVWTVLALPGTILNAPIFIVASVLSRKRAKEALAESQVKITGKDVLATWKILISLGAAPLLYSFYACVTIWITIRAGMPFPWQIASPFIVFAAVPLMSFAALKFGEAGMDVLKSIPPLIVALSGQNRTLEKVKAMRVQLANEVVGVVNDFAPQIYADFDPNRILVPSASVPASSTCGLSRRKGALEASSLELASLELAHPMTWLDERLFGWSRSAGPQDDEAADEGDYDQVVKFIPEPASERSKASARENSYEQLRLRSKAA
ncbi:hypothetical protein FISHEDRAFT_75794 [Fistulina hepatica ATCC 64428]|uniref:Phospholipid/glycerol acyltransferase domain-containing protein n=1 Tax=Fistulina hepatica ATCC 64428 TaxID=1128425 RepID=A0A0D7A601_9AGAR|nr:hypothetical protein FISHEDRAFT_75794 [Fistulina hepatica ATCC 64428]